MNINTQGYGTQPLQGYGDKEIMNDALMSQKFLTDDYNVFANECVCPELRNDFMSILNEEHQIQSDVFSEMQKRGWYQPKPAQQQMIDQAKQKFSNMQ